MRPFLCLSVLLTLFGIGIGKEPEWWQTMSLYQIYPRSYKDSDGDGVGDLQGIMSKLDHMKESNVDAFWLSPFYPSPMVDFGYDIADFNAVDPIYGTLKDFENLVEKSHQMNIKVIVDFVPNHSSDEHVWFQKSVKNIQPYSDYYVWVNGTVLPNGTVVPPTNWVNLFGGSAWTWNDERQAYYLHQFAPQQPDLNFENEDLVEEMKDVMRFWMDRGVDGFRIDSAPYIFEDMRLLDEPLSGITNDSNNYQYTKRIYTKDMPETYDMVQQWHEVIEEYSKKDNVSRVMLIEAYTSDNSTLKYYHYGADFPFNFWFLTNVDSRSSAADFKKVVDGWMAGTPRGSVANWVAGNHDNSRLATRYGPQGAQIITAMTLLLPGVCVTYLGDEIGMKNTWVSWEDTVDPQGLNVGIKEYENYSRDPERTPFQWDNSTSAGFSTNPKTWLPVNSDYPWLNLAAEKASNDSFFKMYKDISALRKWPAVQKGGLVTKLLNDDVFAFARETAGERTVYAVLNFNNESQSVDLTAFDNVPSNLIIYRATLNANLTPGATINPGSVWIPASGAVIYVAPETT